jgi:hypothetical protein
MRGPWPQESVPRPRTNPEAPIQGPDELLVSATTSLLSRRWNGSRKVSTSVKIHSHLVAAMICQKNFFLAVALPSGQARRNVRDVGNCYKANPARAGRSVRTLQEIHVSFVVASNATNFMRINGGCFVHSSCQTARTPAICSVTLQWPTPNTKLLACWRMPNDRMTKLERMSNS